MQEIASVDKTSEDALRESAMGIVNTSNIKQIVRWRYVLLSLPTRRRRSTRRRAPTISISISHLLMTMVVIGPVSSYQRNRQSEHEVNESREPESEPDQSESESDDEESASSISQLRSFMIVK